MHKVMLSTTSIDFRIRVNTIKSSNIDFEKQVINFCKSLDYNKYFTELYWRDYNVRDLIAHCSAYCENDFEFDVYNSWFFKNKNDAIYFQLSWQK